MPIRGLCWCLTYLVPATMLLADTRGAMLYGSGLLVNGTAVPRSSAVLAGDRVVTTATGARLTTAGSTVLLSGSSALVYRGASLQLTSGSVSIATKVGLTTQVRRLHIAPAAKLPAQYEISAQSGPVMIAARQGALAITVNGLTTMLPEGATWQGSDDDKSQSQDDHKKDDSSKRKAGAVVTQNKAVTVGVAAGAGAIAAVVVLSARQPASPHRVSN